MANSAKIPRIDITRERSSTMESIQSLTRAIRESLRMHSIRKEKKRARKNQKKDSALLNVKDSRKVRSKSMDHAYGNDNHILDDYNEISDIGISGVVVSDIGPAIERSITIEDDPPARDHSADEVADVGMVDEETALADEVFHADKNQNNQKQDGAMSGDPNRRHSKSVDEVELAHLRRATSGFQQPDPAVPQQRPLSPQLKSTTAASAAVSRRTNPQMSLDICDTSRQNANQGKQPARQSSVPVQGPRSQSTTDSEMAPTDASVLRKRFARLLVTLRSNKFSMSSLEERISGAAGGVGGGGGTAGGNSGSASSQND